MKTPNMLLYLTKVSYLPEKRQIAVSFANEKNAVSLRYKFFPSIYLPLNKQKAKLIEEILQVYDKQKYSIEKPNKTTLKINCSTLQDLKNIAALLNSSLEIVCLIVEPERQFLLEKGWSYFDCFKFNSKKQLLSKEELFILPKVKFDFMDSSFSRTIQNLIEQNIVASEDLTEKLCLSNLLCVPLSKIPKTKNIILELFLENIFFRNRYCMLNKGNISPKPDFAHPQGNFTDLIELDFSPLWNTLCTFPYFNLGSDSINCSCCKPQGLAADNLAPTSKVKVKFMQDGLYFESFFKEWVNEFHLTNPDKDARLRRMKEWRLVAPPAGPFFRNQELLIPLADAEQLQLSGKLKILNSEHELVWFCKKKESFISKEIGHLNNAISKFEQILSQQEKKSMFKHNLAAIKNLSKNPNYFYRTTYLSTLTDIANYLPFHMTSESTKFYDSQFAEMLNTLRNVILAKFNDVCSEEGIKNILYTERHAFLDSKYALSIAKQFSKRYRLPGPRIVKKWDYLNLS